MSAKARRRRAFLLLSLALATGGLAASLVRERLDAVEAQVGRPLPVVAAAADLPPGRELRPGDLLIRRVPERFVPRDALPAPAEAAGRRTSAALSEGMIVTAGVLGGGERSAGTQGLRRGERAVEVAVAGAGAVGERPAPGGRVDVLVSSEPRAGPGRTTVALEDVELLALRPGPVPGAASGDREEGRGTATATATLRVTLRQAVYLTAAQNFAREIRLLARPSGEKARKQRQTIGAEAP